MTQSLARIPSRPPIRKERAPRARVPNHEPVYVVVERAKLSGTLLTLSNTGGALRLPAQVPRGTLGEMRVQTTAGRVTAVIEFLGKGADGSSSAQAFRFISIESPDRERLSRAIDTMLKQGHGVDSKQSVLVFFQQLAQRLTRAG